MPPPYSATGRVHTVTAPDNGLITYGYDGFLTTSERWDGSIAGTVSRTYDNDFRVASTSVNGTSTVSYQYDADSLVTGAGSLAISREAATGRVSGTTLGTVTTSQGYDPTYGELSSFCTTVAGSTQYSYSITARDLAGRITGKTETIQGVTSTYGYVYDDAGRLWTVTKNGSQTASYTYDSNGNRTGGSYDDQDRMYAYGNATYTYRPAGALATKVVGSQTTYDYDALGNLRSVTLPPPDGRTITYVIDGLNRRIGKKVDGTLTEGNLYDGQLRPIAWLNGSGQVYARFVYATKVNVPEYMVVGSSTYRIVTDHLGSPRLVVNTSTGAIAQRMDFDEWGNVTSDSNPGFQPFGFAGGLYDRDTGLVRFGARDYDPATGRWTNKDPIRFAGGDMNLYVYVWNDPVNFVDPSGLGGTPADVVYGETSSLYPLGGSIYNSSTWNPASFANLQDARSAIAQFMRDNPNASAYAAHPGKTDKWGNKIYEMCKQAASTTPTTDVDDATNFWIGENGAPFGAFGPNTTSQDVVAKFGPFRNVGGGDAQGSQVYIWFYNVGTD